MIYARPLPQAAATADYENRGIPYYVDGGINGPRLHSGYDWRWEGAEWIPYYDNVAPIRDPHSKQRPRRALQQDLFR